jgi:hypothetical protein
MTDPATRETARRLYTFHRCPNTGEVIFATASDDKALCRCNRPNPDRPSEQPGVHAKKFLRRATVDDFLEQEQKRLAKPE